METIYLLLKFLHVAAVIVWVGGILALAVINARLGRTGDPAAQAVMADQSEYFGRVAIGPAMVVTLLAGLATSGVARFPFTSLWIVWGIIGFIVSGTLIGVIGSTARQLGELSRSAARDEARSDAMRGRLRALNAINLLLLASIVWAMVFKPTL